MNIRLPRPFSLPNSVSSGPSNCHFRHAYQAIFNRRVPNFAVFSSRFPAITSTFHKQSLNFPLWVSLDAAPEGVLPNSFRAMPRPESAELMRSWSGDSVLGCSLCLGDWPCIARRGLHSRMLKCISSSYYAREFVSNLRISRSLDSSHCLEVRWI